jgi:hypothetical protein
MALKAAAAPQPHEADAAPAFAGAGVVIGCSLLLAVYAALWAGAWAQGDTLFGLRDRVVHDFSVFWGAGRLAAEGRAAAAYDWPQMQRMLMALFGAPSYPVDKTFLYPPVFLLLLLPLGMLPYAVAAAVWLAGTAAAYLAAVRAILPGGTAMLAALAAPAVLFNAIAGQNGLLTAGLLGGALALLDARPLTAGLLIGLLSYKPQFGPLLPLLLIVTGRWRTLAAAAATVLALFGAATVLFGKAPFIAFLAASTGFAGTFSHGAQQPLHWDRLASLYALLRATGVGAIAAWSAHLALALAAAAASLAIAVSRAPDRLKLAAIPVAGMLIAPYSELTDLAILTVAMAYLAGDGLCRGWGRRDHAALILAFILPLVLMMLPGLRALVGVQYVAVLVGPADCAILAAMIGWRLAAAAEGGR